MGLTGEGQVTLVYIKRNFLLRAFKNFSFKLMFRNNDMDMQKTAAVFSINTKTIPFYLFTLRIRRIN